MKGVIAMGYYSGSEPFFLFILLAVPICYFIAWVIGMGIITEAAKDKGYDDLNGRLWFIGFFGLIFTSAAIVAALPDKKMRSIVSSGAQSNSMTASDDELPEL